MDDRNPVPVGAVVGSSLHHDVKTGSGTHPNSYVMVTGGETAGS
jgi:hypothetical protein